MLYAQVSGTNAGHFVGRRQAVYEFVCLRPARAPSQALGGRSPATAAVSSRPRSRTRRSWTETRVPDSTSRDVESNLTKIESVINGTHARDGPNFV